MEIIVWKVDLNRTSAEAKETPQPSVFFRVLFPPFFFFFFFAYQNFLKFGPPLKKIPGSAHGVLFSGSGEKSKMPKQIRCQGGHIVFTIGPKNTNLVEDIKILLPVKVFFKIPFSGFRRRKCLSIS